MYVYLNRPAMQLTHVQTVGFNAYALSKRSSDLNSIPAPPETLKVCDFHSDA